MVWSVLVSWPHVSQVGKESEEPARELCIKNDSYMSLALKRTLILLFGTGLVLTQCLQLSPWWALVVLKCPSSPQTLKNGHYPVWFSAQTALNNQAPPEGFLHIPSMSVQPPEYHQCSIPHPCSLGEPQTWLSATLLGLWFMPKCKTIIMEQAHVGVDGQKWSTFLFYFYLLICFGKIHGREGLALDSSKVGNGQAFGCNWGFTAILKSDATIFLTITVGTTQSLLWTGSSLPSLTCCQISCSTCSFSAKEIVLLIQNWDWAPGFILISAHIPFRRLARPSLFSVTSRNSLIHLTIYTVWTWRSPYLTDSNNLGQFNCRWYSHNLTMKVGCLHSQH